VTKLREKMIYTSTRERRPPYSPVATIECGYIDTPANMSPLLDGYRASLTVTVDYFCNQAQREHAHQNAERQLVRYVYGNILGLLDVLDAAVNSHDIQAANKIINTMRSEMS